MNVLLLGGTGAMGRYLADAVSRDPGNRCVVTSRRIHSSDRPNLSFVCGNAREDGFVDGLLKRRFDAVVDFMNYGYDEFKSRFGRLLDATGQYVFLSSARVYADSESPLDESSARLLDVSRDEAFLKTQRYALRKARQEDLLLGSGKGNFTVVRPYKTFGEERFQLGAYEKEQWLQRALLGRPIPLRKGLLDRRTTLTHGQDVACVIGRLLGNGRALGEVVQVASPSPLRWADVLEVYRRVLRAACGLSVAVFEYGECGELESLFEGGYQFKYDVLWNRVFDSSKVETILGEEVRYADARESLALCLTHFLTGGGGKVPRRRRGVHENRGRDGVGKRRLCHD